jgi:hypothetical protein
MVGATGRSAIRANAVVHKTTKGGKTQVMKAVLSKLRPP